jgi:hypothetical protein
MIPIAKPIAIELFKKMSKEEIICMALNIGKSVVHNCSQYSPLHEKQDGFGLVYVML